MSCTECAGQVAYADQLRRGFEDLQRTEIDLRDRIIRLEKEKEQIARQLREALDELRIRRAATGYQPVLDKPED